MMNWTYFVTYQTSPALVILSSLLSTVMSCMNENLSLRKTVSGTQILSRTYAIFCSSLVLGKESLASRHICLRYTIIVADCNNNCFMSNTAVLKIKHSVNLYQSQGRRSLWDRGTCSPNIYEGEHPR